MIGIEAAFTGRVSSEPQLRTSKAGKPWCSLSVASRESETVQWVRVAVFGEQAEAAAKIAKGASVYVEGRLTLQTWTTEAGVGRSGLNVTASLVQPLGQIGRRRPPGKRGARYADDDYPRPLAATDRLKPSTDLSGLDQTIPF